MNTYSEAEVVEQYLSRLGSKDESVRKRAVEAIALHVEAAARELSLESFAAFEDAFYARLFAFVHAAESHQKLGGVECIDAIIECSSAEQERKVIKFANALSNSLRHQTDADVLAKVASAFGHMARASTVNHFDYVEHELNKSLEWLVEVQGTRKLAACLVLRQMAENAPTIFFARTQKFFETIWSPLRDPKQQVREAAADALSAALAILKFRRTVYHLQWYCSIYDQIHVGFGTASVESIHGSILVVREALKHTGDFMVPRFKEVCTAIMRFQDSKHRIVRLAIVELLPQLAQFCPDPFARGYLDTAITFLIKCAKNDLRPSAFESLGRLSRAVGQHMVNYLDKLLGLVREALGKRGKDFCPEVLQCIADMVRGLRVSLKDSILELLDPIFNVGLNRALIDTLMVISEEIPQHQRIIQERLLREVSVILYGKEFEPPGKFRSRRGHSATRAAPLRSSSSLSSLRRTAGSKPIVTSPKARHAQANAKMDTELVMLSLSTLGGLHMDVCLLPFVQECVVTYLDWPNEDIRIEAARTCSSLLLPKDRTVLLRGPSASVIEKVLQLLLEVAVTDPSAAVRKTVLTAIDTRFDRFLCQIHHVSTVSFVLGDEVFDIRVEAIKVLGRLARLNPAAVLPPLRQHLLHLISGISYTHDIKQKEECIVMLTSFLAESSLQRIVKPFMHTIVHSLPLRDDVRLATAGLEAMGALCLVMREDMILYVDKLIPVIIENMQDQSSARKQEVSICTLGQLVGATGHVIRPYLQYPTLLPRALDLIMQNSTGTPWSLRREVLRTVGILGALDPFKFNLILEHLQRQKQRKAQAETTGGGAPHTGTPLGSTPNASAGNVSRKNPSVGVGPRTFPCAPGAGSLAQETGQTISISIPSGVSPNATNRGKELLQPGAGGLMREEDEDLIPAHQVMYEQSVMTAQPVPVSAETIRLTPTNPDYYPRVVINALMKIMRDTSLSMHHSAVTQAVMSIFRSLGLKSVPFLDHIIPYMVQVVRQCGPGLRESLLQQFSALAVILKQHLAPFLPGIFDIICEYWHENLEQVCSLTEEMATSARDEVMEYVPKFLPLLLSTLVPPRSSGSPDTKLIRTLNCVGQLREVLTPYLHLVIPVLCKLIDQVSQNPLDLLATVSTLQQISSNNALRSCPQMASRVTHTLMNLLNAIEPGEQHEKLTRVVSQTMCDLIQQLGSRFLTFETRVRSQFRKAGISTERLDTLINSLRSNPQSLLNSSHGDKINGSHTQANLSPTEGILQSSASVQRMAQYSTNTYGVQKQPVTQQTLQRAWDVSQRSTAEDWNEWMRRFSVELLRESPSPALRSCSALAQTYSPLARELFHAGFVSCWYELSEPYQEHLVRSLETAFGSPYIPPEILQTLLNLAEFMEHDVSALPIDIRVLAELAQKCHAYAKALHYKELEFHTQPAACIEALISINKKLDQHDAAIGVLKFAQKKHISSAITIKESWLAKLGDFQEALTLYRQRHLQDEKDPWPIVGQMKCLDALGQWEDCINVSREHWELLEKNVDTRALRKAAVIGARAAHTLSEWKTMQTYVSHLGTNEEGAFYNAVLAVHAGEYEKAAHFIDVSRKQLDKSLTALLSESYSRSYISIVTVQQLSELEEIIALKRLKLDRPDVDMQKRLLITKWRKRLQGCKASIPVWLHILTLRRMLVNTREDWQSWLDLEALCRHSGNLALARKILDTSKDARNAYAHMRTSQESMFASSTVDASLGALVPSLLQAVSPTGVNARFEFASLRQQWYVGSKAEAIQRLEALLESIPVEDTQMKVDCVLKLGSWKLAIAGHGVAPDPATRTTVLSLYQRATEFSKDNYRAWHRWGLANFHAAEEMIKKRVGGGPSSVHLKPYLVNAAQGLLRAISLGTKRWSASVQQDMLCLLTVWFRHGNMTEVHKALSEGLSAVHVDTWLGVLPQLIARIHTQDDNTRILLHQLLLRLGTRHVQALVYPMSVALKSPKLERRQAAERIMSSLRQHSAQLLDQALLVSHELIRVAILWHEQWHENLEEASRLYFGEGNVRGMLDTVLPLHEELEKGPTTLRERAFNDSSGQELRDAHEYLKRYLEIMKANGKEVPVSGAAPGLRKRRKSVVTEEEQYLHHAWDLYYNVFKRINKQLAHFTTLELEYVSPALQLARDLDLAVPGTYRVSGQAVRIARFGPSVQVITSKQRPRKLTMYGENGLTFMFLLKGHEDLRQDERAMQLFGLVNALLERDRRTESHDLSIQRYAVVPISPNTGLVGWVPQCDTFHALIRDYRDKRNVVLNIEHRLMTQMYQDYDSLTLMQKLEAFEYALENTDGQDLYKVLWLTSDTSETWLHRRANYTRSLAVMSMVGYILGLGDRHPSNLMLDRTTGKVLHIDFGDCFEVAMHRERFPERIPFRLTRMLARAMEVSGIEGNYRLTCERVMNVLRENRDSLIAMLEAFVHDPLISWRLLNPHQTRQSPIHAQEAAASTVAEAKAKSPLPAPQAARVPAPAPALAPAPAPAPVPVPVQQLPLPETESAVEVPKRAPHNVARVELEFERDDDKPDAKAHQAWSDEGSSECSDSSHANSDGGGDSEGEEEHPMSVVARKTARDPLNSSRPRLVTDGEPIALSSSHAPAKAQATVANGVKSKGEPSQYKEDLHVQMMHMADSLQETRMLIAGASVANSRLDHRSTRERSLVKAMGPEGADAPQEELTEKAVAVIRRVNDKLTGMDFGNAQPLDVPEQVERLIGQATANENLCQCFVGWCPFW